MWWLLRENCHELFSKLTSARDSKSWLNKYSVMTLLNLCFVNL